MAAVKTNIDARGIARVLLDRPEVHNAFDDALIAELTKTFQALDGDGRVRVVVLTGAGKSFSAGGDLNWMKRMAGYSMAENVRDAEGLGALMASLDRLAKPTLGLVNGAAYGGGVGLVACCDIVIAASTAKFCLSEVKLGLIPAVISPYVVRAMGARAARRYFLTAEVFDAEDARRLGLAHEVVAPEDVEAAGARLVEVLLQAGPDAQAAAKALIARVAGAPIDEALIADTARRIAEIRATDEGREGVSAFLEKRKPRWSR
ncbi:MAG TPA: enoyl-CoA hydratase-related protein [Alphaproteobacteria bacterium]|jgi:methylglutaconyl-CoA hydratase|nr:enoyl-CoA hydratase-related protein [Alphaproteobacteria bacterium]